MQPPGYNFAVGLTVKLFPDRFGDVLWAAQIAMGAAIAVLLFRLICRLGVPVACACVLSSIFVISPGCVLFEDLASYEYPVLLFLLLSAVALARFCESLSGNGTAELAAGSPTIPGPVPIATSLWPNSFGPENGRSQTRLATAGRRFAALWGRSATCQLLLPRAAKDGPAEPVAAGSPPIPGLEDRRSRPVPLATRWALAFFGCLLVLALVRNSFHIVYLLAVAAGMLWFLPAGRRAILIGVLPAVLIGGGVYVKNGLLFGRFVASTWAGMATGVTTSFQLTDEEADDLVKRGIVSPLAKIPPFSGLSDYEPYIHRPPKTGIPVLDQDETSTGHPNFNNLAHLQLHDQYLVNSIAIWRNYPIAYVRSVLIAWFSYFRPASDSEYFDVAPAPIQTWERAFNALVFGQVRRTEDRENFLQLKQSGHNLSRVLYTGMFLLIVIPATVIWGLAQLVSPRRRRRWTQAQLAVLGFMLFTIVYITLVSTLLSSFDGNRYRFPLDGFFIALFGGMLTATPFGRGSETVTEP